jgi:hypothetical protein
VRDIPLAVVTALKANTAVAAIVGTRVYRKGSVPTNPTIPYIVVSKVDNNPGEDTSTTQYETSRIRCTGFETSDLKADALSEAIRTVLHRKTITVPATSTTGGVYLVSIFDAGSVPDENTDIPLYMYHRDFMIEFT